MAKHCPTCNYSTENEFDGDCPICLKPLITHKDYDRGSNAGPWYSRMLSAQKFQLYVFVAFSIVGIIYFTRMLINGPP